MRRIVLITVGLLMAGMAYGQRDSVAVCLERIIAAEPDSVRIDYADRLTGFLKNIGYGTYPTLSPVRGIGYKNSRGTEMFSLCVPLKQGMAYYNWLRQEDGEQIRALRSLPGEEEGETPACLFFDLIPFRSGGGDYLALLGWNQGSRSNRKGIWIARLDAGGKISFKTKLIRQGKKRVSSLVFEYMKEGNMMLKQDKNGKRIVFDHLTPIDKKYEGYFMFYGPDGSYDSLELSGGVWVFGEMKKVKGQKMERSRKKPENGLGAKSSDLPAEGDENE